MRRTFLAFLSSFAQTSKPGLIQSVNWDQITDQNFQIMTLDTKVDFGPCEKLDKVNFWIENIIFNQKESGWNDSPIQKIYEEIADKRYS